MTKKDYVIIAKVIKEVSDRISDDETCHFNGEDTLDLLVAKLSAAFILDNKQFNDVKFRTAIYGAHV